MNIFALDNHPVIAAENQCDKHVVKMPLESAQILSTAHRLLDGSKAPDVVYKPTHSKHPCVVWVMQTQANYIWLYQHFIALCKEYKYRYNREHLSYTKLKDILCHYPKNIPLGGQTPFVQAMPDDVKNKDSIQAYRDYYMQYKKHIATWNKNRTPPNWWKIS